VVALTSFSRSIRLQVRADGFLSISEPQVAGQSELGADRARPAADDSDAENIAVGEPGRRLDPTRLAEAAGRFPHAIVGQEAVRIRTLEGHDVVNSTQGHNI
jgi:hypothetical protein